MAEIKDSQLIRDALGSPVPQYWDETSQMYIARTVDGSFADVDFSKVRLLRDKLGSPIPQLWDTETARFVPGKGGGNGEVTIESVPGLRSELDQTTATLADTLKKGQVAVTDIDKNKGKFDQTYMSDEFLQQMAGTTPVNAVPADYSLTTIKYADNSITSKKVEFMRKSSNLYNGNTAIPNKSISSTTGEMTDSTGNSASDFIPVLPLTTYTSTYMARAYFYDKNKVFVRASATGENPTFTTLSNVQFVKMVVAVSRLYDAQLNVGSVVLPYERFYEEVKPDNIPENGLTSGKYASGSVTPRKTSFIQRGTNLFNRYDFSSNTNFDSATGAIYTSTGHVLGGFIEVDENKVYTSNYSLKYGFYDINKKWIRYIGSGVTPGVTHSVTTPPRAAYVRIVANEGEFNLNQLNEGSVLLPYEEYRVKVAGVEIENNPKLTIPEKLAEFKATDKYVVEGATDGTYSSPVLPALPELASYTTAQMFALYDALVTAYPNYVTRTVLGQDGLGENIYQYDFKPAAVDIVGTTVKFPKMILVSGVHGSEKAGVYALYQSMKQICENWKNDEVLDTLRWNVHFIVVPVVNLYSFNGNATRRNENGVDIARNFPTDWVFEADTTSPTYGGTAPLTEQGSILVDQLMKANKDAVYFTSFHNFFTPPSTNYFIWNAAATQLQVNLGKRLISKLSRKWKKQYNWLPQDETTFFGYASMSAPQGSESRQAAAYGIHGSTFEIGQEFFLEATPSAHSSIVNTLGAETFTNWLLLNLKHNTDFYNTNKRLF